MALARRVAVQNRAILRLVWHNFGLQRGAAPNGNRP